MLAGDFRWRDTRRRVPNFRFGYTAFLANVLEKSWGADGAAPSKC